MQFVNFSLDQVIPTRSSSSQLLSLTRKVQSNVSTWTLCLGLQISSDLSLCCAFWNAIGSTSVLCFSAVQLPKLAKPALRRFRSWLSFGRMFSTSMEMEIASAASGQKRSRRKGSRHEGISVVPKTDFTPIGQSLDMVIT